MCKLLRHEYALQEPGLALAPVFLTLAKGSRPKLDVMMEYGGSTLRWRGPDALGMLEQSVFLGLLSIANQQSLRLCPENQGSHGAKLLAKLEVDGKAISMKLCVLTASWSEIAAAAGYASIGGKNRENVKMAVRRLAETTMWELRGNEERACRILSWIRSRDDTVMIALNPRATTALLHGQYAHISLAERRQLDSDPARALHAWLSGSLRVGATQRYIIDKLQTHVWGSAVTGGALRKRRSSLCAALADIGHLQSWRCSFSGDGRVDVIRLRGKRVTAKGTIGNATGPLVTVQIDSSS
jgi:hypothetical protein